MEEHEETAEDLDSRQSGGKGAALTYLQPVFPALLLITALGLISCWRRRSTRSLACAAFGLAGLFLFSWPPVSWVLLGTLEWRYPRQALPAGEAEAIVVLASYVLPPSATRPYAVVAGDTYQRCLHAAWLYKHWRPLPVLASGGNPNGAGQSYADAMQRVLEAEGVPDGLIWKEEKSRSTHQAAIYVAEILQKKGIRRIALVTEAYHMPRAEGCFRRAGLTVAAAPCRFHTFALNLERLMPGEEAIGWSENVMHEWGGLLAYRLRGWI